MNNKKVIDINSYKIQKQLDENYERELKDLERIATQMKDFSIAESDAYEEALDRIFIPTGENFFDYEKSLEESFDQLDKHFNGNSEDVEVIVYKIKEKEEEKPNGR